MPRSLWHKGFRDFCGKSLYAGGKRIFLLFFPADFPPNKKYESIQRNTDNESSLSVFRELVLKCDPQRENKGVLVAFNRIYLYLCVSNP